MIVLSELPKAHFQAFDMDLKQDRQCKIELTLLPPPLPEIHDIAQPASLHSRGRAARHCRA